MNQHKNENVTLRLSDIRLDIYELLFRKLQQEGFSPPLGSRRWQRQKISIKKGTYTTIAIEGSFPGGQNVFDSRTRQLLDDILQNKIECSFKISGISKNKLLDELNKRGIAFVAIREQNDGVILTIHYSNDDLMPPYWLYYAVSDSFDTETRVADIETCDIELSVRRRT